MTIQVLVTTMHATDFSLVEKMNLRDVDVIIANQTDHCSYMEKNFPEYNVHACMISSNTVGVSFNRNIAIEYAVADVIVFADDDVVFTDHFANIVSREFKEHLSADVIKFDCISKNPLRPFGDQRPQHFQKARIWNVMSAGIHALAMRRKEFLKYDIRFPCSIGPGKEYNFGEDSCFLIMLLKSKLRFFVSNQLIAAADQNVSTWFTGYTEQYFYFSGYIYAKNYGILAWPMLLRHAYKLKNEKNNQIGFVKILKLMGQGVREYHH